MVSASSAAAGGESAGGAGRIAGWISPYVPEADDGILTSAGICEGFADSGVSSTVLIFAGFAGLVARRLSPSPAKQVAVELATHDALAAHAEAEYGITSILWVPRILTWLSLLPVHSEPELVRGVISPHHWSRPMPSICSLRACSDVPARAGSTRHSLPCRPTSIRTGWQVAV